MSQVLVCCSRTPHLDYSIGVTILLNLPCIVEDLLKFELPRIRLVVDHSRILSLVDADSDSLYHIIKKESPYPSERVEFDVLGGEAGRGSRTDNHLNCLFHHD